MIGKQQHDLWVFAYGSLMWRPGFRHQEMRRARLVGYSRRFCVTSVHHRGSAARPGLVLGLDRGGVCEGVAYRVAAADVAQVLRYLREREQVNGVYREAQVPIELEGADRRAVMAVAYLVERAHPSYVARMGLVAQARLIRGARGRSGVNLDYLRNTLRHMRALGIRERELERLSAVIGGLFSHEGCCELASPRAEALRRTVCGRCGPSWLGGVRRMRPGQRRRFLYRQRL